MKPLSIITAMFICVIVASITFPAYAREAEAERQGKPFPPERIEEIEEEGIKNTKVILGEPDDPKLPENSLDLALMGNVYHEVENPVALLKSIARSLKSDGRRFP